MAISNRIGVIADSLGYDLRGNLQAAKQLGAEGVQLWAIEGEMDPARLTKEDRAALKAFLEELGLKLSALCADYGGRGFKDPAENEWKLERSKRALDLALDLGCNIVTTHIGIVPESPEDPDYKVLQSACSELAAYASRHQGYFAVETGPEPAARLKSFLDSLDSKGMAVNFDPANMVMVTGDDPVQGVYTLRDYIVHTHVKDGIRLREVDPHEVYGLLDHEVIAEMGEGGAGFREVPPGEGSVDYPAYFAALQDIGYTGYLTVEREVGDTPEADIAGAVSFIRSFREPAPERS
ncbi:xylose isomerase [Paenibacillus sp. PK3_47]|uniref:sugar phosphate isomerase/epimerase family protein n=1 Tax=Paenibacillus sp. PK3_47 TaxID=2072642 RepID=UPI00201E37CC|nr:sugar phosphate isomerase/epimerase family protein [Paenibacillus sp. PK3_47]UQZ36899.1 xylose isomerase [Paenibacillus sp. PK3_47]